MCKHCLVQNVFNVQFNWLFSLEIVEKSRLLCIVYKKILGIIMPMLAQLLSIGVDTSYGVMLMLLHISDTNI